MSTPPIQSSDIPGFVDLPQDVDEAAGGQATTEAAGDADGEPDNHPRGPGHSSEHGDFYHANRMQQQLFGGGANGAQPQGSGASQAQAQADATPPRHGEGPHGDRPRHDGTPRGEGHRGSDGPRGGDGGYRGDGPRGGDSPPGQQRPGHGPDGTPNGHSQRNASTQPGNNVLPGNPATGNGRVDGQQMPPWAGVPGMGASHGHGGGFGQLGSFVGQALGHLLGGTGHAASMLLRPGEGLLPGLPFHAGNTAPNLPHLPATVVDTVRTATQGVTQALPGANAPAQVAHQPTTLPNEAASAQPRTPLQSGTNSTSTQNTTAAHEASMPLRGTNAPAQQAPTTTTSAQAAQATATSPTRIATAAGETMHASPTAASNRSPLAESASPAAGPRTPHGVENPALNTQAAAQNAARGAPGMQAVQAIQSGTLTLAFAPQIAASIDDGAEALNHTALFRGQGADGAESLRDILGRNYVFSADGKLAMRAEERRAVDPVQASRTEAIDEDRFANDGELSTHELVWKVVVPAFVGVGTLLGGAAVGVATAAGSTGMASAFLLVAAASILGYGAVRAGTALREMADAGQRIHPLENPAARTQWLAAGSQSLGSVVSLALLLV